MNKAERLTELQQKCYACKKCAIGGQDVDGHLSNVWSNMSMKAQIMVIGQNPGYVEVERGKPFVGPSGEFFDKAIEEVLGIDRTHFYITNTCHCYTAKNRKPSNVEIENCCEFLDAEIEAVNPKIIVTLGAPSLEQVTGRKGIMKLHGQKIISLRYKKNVLPLLHPSPRNMNKPELKVKFYQDLEVLKEYLNGR